MAGGKRAGGGVPRSGDRSDDAIVNRYDWAHIAEKPVASTKCSGRCAPKTGQDSSTSPNDSRQRAARVLFQLQPG